jgi:putative ABC transport system permease protein
MVRPSLASWRMPPIGAWCRDPENNPNDPDVFFPLSQSPSARLQIAAQGPGAGSVSAIGQLIRAEVRRLDSTLPVYGMTSMRDVVDAEVAASRAATRQLGAFAGLGLILAATGLFGVMAYTVSRRTNEIGVRIALGANRGKVLTSFLAQGVVLVAMGLAIGLGAASVVTRVVASQLYGVVPLDTVTYAAVALVVLSVGALAGLVPSLRAMRVDPVVALRAE